jgi:DNA-binding PadR family transcriptional regulator
MANNAMMLKGLVELLIFRIMEDQGEIYAFELSGLVSEYSNGLIQIQYPSLYPPLHRLKERGYISIEEKIVANRKRTYYILRESGRAYYNEIKQDYMTISRGMDNVLTYSKKGERSKE